MASGNRKKTQELILNYIKKIVIGKQTNYELYKELFDSMNDKEFDEFMVKLKDGKATLSVIIPNDNSERTQYKVDIKNNIKLAKELGFDFFQHLRVGATDEIPEHMTPNKHMILKLPVRRVAQLVTKKISIPQDNVHIDQSSGQVTGASKGSKLTNPELQILIGLGLDKSIKELMKVRGGDLGANAAMTGMLVKHGKTSQQSIAPYATGVVSKDTLKSYLNGMHLYVRT